MLRDDIEAAVRALRARPAFATLIVCCLAIGIGANIAMFSIANVLFLRPPAGVRNAEALSRLEVVRRAGILQSPDGGALSYPDFVDVSAARGVFSSLAASRHSMLTIGRGIEAEQLEGEFVSRDYFRTLGARTARGRFFAADEDSVRGLRPAVVLGYSYWQSHFQGRDVVGRTLTINDRLYTIVGVAERDFRGVGYRRVEMWVPVVEIEPYMGHDALTDRTLEMFTATARRAPGISVAQVEAAATAQMVATAPSDRRLDQHPKIIARASSFGGSVDSPPQATLVLWLFGAVAFVLMIACANVANLLIARTVQRRHEIAVRLSLGVGRPRLARQMLIESVILALGGGVAGLLLAWLGTSAWRMPELAARPTPWDPAVLAFTGGLALLTAIAFGVAPALTAIKMDLSLLLKERAASASRTRVSARGALIALQAALSLVVLAGSGLFIRSLQKMSAIDLDMDADHVVFVDPKLNADQVDSARREAVLARVVERLGAVPGVRAVSVEDIPRFRGIAILDAKRPGPDSIPAEARAFQPRVDFVGPSYAEALGTPVVLGRDITAADRAGSQPVVVVSQRMAREYWPGQNAIGQCLLIAFQGDKSTPCWYVIGVVGDAPMNIAEEHRTYYYIPRAQRSLPYQPTIIVRTAGPSHAALETIRDAVLEASPEILYAETNTVPMLLADQFAPARLAALLFTLFGIAALGLTAIGLYGVVAYLVAQRTREVGIRMALGSTTVGAVALMARQGAKPVAVGLLAGLVGAVLVTRFLQSLLYNVSPTDGPSFAAAAALLGLVAAVACIVPARKAAQVDPVVALRAE
ncbi:MAG TPA: ABC transporter permease [Gemmatimonadaceae bacterium]|nr:ABC transporter permease [Gemmatimonadaceae bacterium]